MKKLFVIAVIAMAVVACNNSGKKEETKTDTSKTETTSPPPDTPTVPADTTKTPVDTTTAKP